MLLNRDYDNDMHTVHTRKMTVMPTMVDKTLTFMDFLYGVMLKWIKLSC